MALKIKIIKDSTGNPNYLLKATAIKHDISRFASQTGLPSDTALDPSVLTIDLGQAIEQISITGIIDDSPTAGQPSLANMETIAKNWWDIGSSLNNLPRIETTSGTYIGHIKTLNLHRSGEYENRWDFELTFVVRTTA